MRPAHKALCLALLCAPPAALAQGWVDFSSTECRCAASFPGASRQTPREAKTPDGRKVVTQFREFTQGGRYFAVSWLQMPGAPKDAAAKGRMLEAASAAALKANPGSAQLSKRSVTLGGVSGLAYAIDLPKDKTRVRQQIFVAGDRLVEQTYSGPTGSETGPDVERFLGSLKLQP